MARFEIGKNINMISINSQAKGIFHHIVSSSLFNEFHQNTKLPTEQKGGKGRK